MKIAIVIIYFTDPMNSFFTIVYFRRGFNSGGDSTCIMWDIPTAVSLSIFPDHNGDVMSVSMNPTDPNMFVSGSCDSTAAIWDIRNNEQKCIEQYSGMWCCFCCFGCVFFLFFFVFFFCLFFCGACLPKVTDIYYSLLSPLSSFFSRSRV